MAKEVKYKDPNCYNEAVIAYRDQFELMPNKGFRQDIAVTVKTYEDLCIWTELLSRWGYTCRQTGKWKPRNPLDVKGMLTVFEMKVRERERLEQNNGHGKASAVSTRGRKGISRRGDSDVPKMPSEPPSEYFRTRKVVF